MGNFSVLSGWWFPTIFLDGEVSLQVCRGLLLYGLSSNILTTGADQGFLILLFLRPLQVLHRVAHQRSLFRLLWCGKVLPSSGRQHHSTPLEHSTEVQSDSDSSDEASSCVVFVCPSASSCPDVVAPPFQHSSCHGKCTPCSE